MGDDRAESSQHVLDRVEAAREKQQQRFAGREGMYANSDMGTGDIQTYCVLTDEARQLLDISVRRMQMSARSYHRTLKLSRTIADLVNAEVLDVAHVAEALQYRARQT